MIPNYTPEYINKIKENNSNLARALTEEKRKYAYLYTEKETLDKRVLQLTKKSHDQKKCVEYLLDVLRQTLHYLKDQSTKVEKMINKKADDFNDRMSLFLTPNFLDNSNFNIPSPTPTRKSYEFDTNFINDNRRCNILKKSAKSFDGINKESYLINTSNGEDKLMSTSTSSCNASSFEGIPEFGDEDVDCLREETKRETFNSCTEVNSSPAELLANYNKTVIEIQDMELTYVHNTNSGRILTVADMELASAQNTNTVNASNTNENNDDGIVIECKSDQSVLLSNKNNKCNSESAVIQETHNNTTTEEKFDTVYSDILSNKCVEKNSKCLSKTSTIEEPSTSETITEVTQINMLTLIPNILIDRLNELSSTNNNTIGEKNVSKQRTADNGNKPGELNNMQLIHTIDDTNIIKKRPRGNADKRRKSSETVDEVSNSNKKEKSSKIDDEISNSIKKKQSSKIEKKPLTSKQTQSSKTIKKGELSKLNEMSTKSSKSEELNKKNEPSINSSIRLSFKIPNKSNRIKRTTSLNINYKEPTIREFFFWKSID